MKLSSNKTLNSDIQPNYLNYRENSFQNIHDPLPYQTHFSNQRQNPHQNPLIYNNKFMANKIENKTIIPVKSRSNSLNLKLKNSGKQKNIHNFTREELKDQINDILRIRIPFFENSILKTLSAFTFLSGNGPYHEGLLFFTTNKNFYIAQSYPITFIKVYDFFGGISEIISFNNINKDSKKYTVSEIYSTQEPIKLYDVLNIINNLPNKYNLINDNCQNFCNNILDTLKNNYKIEMEEKPNLEKINFLKKQKKTKNNLIPIYRPLYYSGKFNNY
jgi:hypothetical protein